MRFQIFPNKFENKRSPDDLDPDVPEITVWCHSIVEEETGKRIKAIGYLTAECSGGYVPIHFSRLSGTAAQMLGNGLKFKETPEEVSFGDMSKMPLIPPHHLRQPRWCPGSGHYSVVSTRDISDRLKRVVYGNTVPGADAGYKLALEMVSKNFINISIGCQKNTIVEFKADNFSTEFECFGDWEDDGTQYVLGRPKTTHDQRKPSKHLCFVYEHANTGKSTLFMGVTAKCERDFPADNAWKIGFYLALTGGYTLPTDLSIYSEQ